MRSVVLEKVLFSHPPKELWSEQVVAMKVVFLYCGVLYNSRRVPVKMAEQGSLFDLELK
jgi:hypothetical protein